MPTIEEVRIERQMSQAELAGRARVGISTVSRMERGKRVSDASLKAVCLALDISPTDVTGINRFIPVVHRRRHKNG